MKKRLFSTLLAIAMLVVLVVPAHASAVDELSSAEPPTPSGFSYVTSVRRNAEFDAFFDGTVVTLTGFIPGMGIVSAAVSISKGFAELFDDDSLPVKYVDHIYEADHPEAEFGVPYVYWHKLEYSFELPDGNTYSRWSDYYEYAVAPR